MPNPAPRPPPPTDRPTTPNLDALIRSALKGGDVDSVRAALQSTPANVVPFEPRPPARGAPAAPAPVVPAAPAAPVVPAVPAPAVPAPAVPVVPAAPVPVLASVAPQEDPAALIAQIQALAVQLSATWAEADPDAWARDTAALIGLAQAVASLSPPKPRTVTLPPIRHPYLLSLDGADQASMAPTVADALGVDGVTARQLCLGGHIRVALRSADQADLAQRATRLRQASWLGAAVLTREAVLALPPADVLMGRSALGWRVCMESLWERDNDVRSLPEGERIALDDVLVAVPGEVTFRPIKADGTLGVERRLGVLDLHLSERVVRVVEGISDLSGLPGYRPDAARTSLTGLIDGLSTLWPRVEIEARRICDGWPAWEEHSRVSRLHRLALMQPS